MFVVGACVEIEFHPGIFHSIAADGGQVFNHIAEGPLPLFTLSVLLEERLEPLPTFTTPKLQGRLLGFGAQRVIPALVCLEMTQR